MSWIPIRLAPFDERGRVRICDVTRPKRSSRSVTEFFYIRSLATYFRGPLVRVYLQSGTEV